MQASPHPPVPAFGHDTPHKLLRQRCREWAAQPALRHKRRGIWSSVSWAQYYERARAVGLALDALGLRRGDAVAVLSENRPEWLYADMGVQCMGLLSVGIYPTSSPQQVLFILRDARVRVLFVENQEQYDKALAVRDQCPALERIVVTDLGGLRGLDDAMTIDFAGLMAQGEARAAREADVFERAIDAGRPEEIAFLVYTSGTTGAAKGAMIANRNLTFQISSVRQYLNLDPGDRTLSFLPLCHIAERMSTVFNPLAQGQIVHFPENAGTVFNDVREVAPHVIFGPPRFWRSCTRRSRSTCKMPSRWPDVSMRTCWLKVRRWPRRGWTGRPSPGGARSATACSRPWRCPTCAASSVCRTSRPR